MVIGRIPRFRYRNRLLDILAGAAAVTTAYAIEILGRHTGFLCD